jgi:hypothetical protein
MSTSTLGLARYDAMCTAIAECHQIDEVKDLRDKAKALEVYAAQARNLDAERGAAAVRIRAERRVGQLLAEMKAAGQRQDRGGNGGHNARNQTSQSATSAPTAAKETLADLGITRDQSSQWQKLAEIPEEKFEEALATPFVRPTTEGVLARHFPQQEPQPTFRMDTRAMAIWGFLRDAGQKDGIFERPLSEWLVGMTEGMREDIARLAPKLAAWLTPKEGLK